MQKMYGKDNPHPRGIIGEMFANQLIKNGWREETRGYDSHFWISPDDEEIGKLEFAFEHLRRHFAKIGS